MYERQWGARVRTEHRAGGAREDRRTGTHRLDASRLASCVVLFEVRPNTAPKEGKVLWASSRCTVDPRCWPMTAQVF